MLYGVDILGMDWKNKLKFWQKPERKTKEKKIKKEGPSQTEKTVEKRQIAEESVKILRAKSKSGYANKILLRPMVTEKSATLGGLRKYTFEIAPRANKIEVARAICDLYGEKPVAVNILKISGKKVRYGRNLGRRKNWKKAVVTFAPGIKLELYEGV